MRRIALVLIGLTLFWGSADALAASGNPVVFTTPPSSNPLSSENVEAITRDARGFLWIGTTDGLNRYDGYEFVSYYHQPDDPASLPDHFVQDLLTHPDGSLWVGTLGGLARYDEAMDRFVSYQVDPEDWRSLSNDSVGALLVDRAERLWVGTFWGLNRYVPESDDFERYNPEVGLPGQVLPVTDIQALAEDLDGNLWIGTRLQGLVRFHPKTGEVRHFVSRSSDPHSLSDNEVRSILVDRQGRVWVGTYGGLDLYRPDSDSFERIRHDPRDPKSLGSNRIESLWLGPGGDLWIGTDGAGLDVWQPGSDVFMHHRFDEQDPSSLAGDVVRTIHGDSRGNVWLGLYGGGLQRENPTVAPIRHVRRRPGQDDSLSHSTVLSFAESADGDLWVGTEDGLNQFRREQRILELKHDPLDGRSLGAKAVLSLEFDRRGRLWAGTFFGGLHLYEPESRTFRRFPHRPDEPDSPEAPGNPHVWSIHEDPDGTLWLGTFGGLDRFDPESERFEHFRYDHEDPRSIPHEIIWHVTHTRDGRLWVASQQGFGYFKPETETFHNYRHDRGDPKSLPFDHISHLHEGADGMIWLATEGGGLIRFDRRDESFQSFRRRDGLPSDTVFSVVEDTEQRIWLTSGNSLFRLDPQTGQHLVLDPDDGIRAGYFKRGSHLRLRSGELLFGATRGFLRFKPGRLEMRQAPSSIALTGFQVFGRDVPVDPEGPLTRQISVAEEIHLKHDQSVLQFSFSALDLAAPQKVRYRYQLEGFDKGWSPSGPERRATYTNLDPGNYVLKVSASHAGGPWTEDAASIRLTVHPPYWETLWFRGLCVALALALTAIAYQLRTRSIRRRNRHLRREIHERLRVEAEHGRLMTEMEKRNAELQRLTYTLSHDLKTPLVTVQGFVGALEQDLAAEDWRGVEQDLSYIRAATGRMGTLLGELLRLRRVATEALDLKPVDLARAVADTLAISAGVVRDHRVDVRLPQDLSPVTADSSRLIEVLQNLVENAVKFRRPDVDLHVDISAENLPGEPAQVLCRVRDNGRGIAAEHQEQIFGLFKRLDSTGSGHGTGLSLVRSIVELHGGRIWVESEGPGQGSTFCLVLPSARPAHRTDAI